MKNAKKSFDCQRAFDDVTVCEWAANGFKANRQIGGFDEVIVCECVQTVVETMVKVRKIVDFFEAPPPRLSARAKKNSKGAPSFAERDYRENPHPETRAGENGG